MISETVHKRFDARGKIREFPLGRVEGETPYASLSVRKSQ
jgi:hypothetical protein